MAPLRPANVGMRVGWTDTFADRFEGTPLKHVALTVRGRPGPAVQGDAMVTRAGIEGGPVYAIGAAIRDALDADGRCVLEVDLRPALTVDQLDRPAAAPPAEGLGVELAPSDRSASTRSASRCSGSQRSGPADRPGGRWPRWSRRCRSW